MRGMTLEKIAYFCNGTYFGPEEKKSCSVSGVAIDSRKIEDNFLFIPIKGERVDGHRFIWDVFHKGAACVLTEHPLVEEELAMLPEDAEGYPYILVESCEQALKDVAEYYRSVLGITVVGITGSVGKTSTKEMVASVLKEGYQVLKTEGNYNNEIGLPLTIFNLRDEHEVAVLEMGISDFGEMHRLAKVARPDICVITNIGPCHLENLKDREGVLRAKSEIFDFLKPEGKIFLNGDDDMLRTVAGINGIEPVYFGKGETNQIYADHVESLGLKGTKCDIHDGNITLPVMIPVPGEHMVNNSLAAYAVGKSLGLDSKQIKEGIEQVSLNKGRTNLITTNGITIIDDCYNANPVSMKAAIDVLEYGLGRKVAILGDMFELGEDEVKLHKEVGEYADGKTIDMIVCVGTLAKNIGTHAKSKQVFIFDTKAELLREVSGLIEKGDTVLVKASHGMGFDEVVKELEAL